MSEHISNDTPQPVKKRSRAGILIAIILLLAIALGGVVYLLRSRAANEFDLAIRMHDTPRVRELVQRYPRIILPTSRLNSTLLLFAGDDPETFRFLVEHGASLNALTDTGRTPLHVASSMGNVKVAEYLFTRGVDANIQSANGETPLHALARAAAFLPPPVTLKMLDLLVAHNADVNKADTQGSTPIEVCENAAMIRALLTRGVQHDRFARKAKSANALPTAAGKNDLEMVELYVEHGADVNINDTSIKKETALHHAVRNNNLAMARFLLEHKANANAVDWHDKTPLFYAVQSKKTAIAGLLRKYGGKE